MNAGSVRFALAFSRRADFAFRFCVSDHHDCGEKLLSRVLSRINERKHSSERIGAVARREHVLRRRRCVQIVGVQTADHARVAEGRVLRCRPQSRSPDWTRG